MTQVTISKWGDILAVPLPADVVQAGDWEDGARVEIRADGHDILIRRIGAEDEVASWFRGKLMEQWNAEYAAAAAEVGRGPDVGRETVSE